MAPHRPRPSRRHALHAGDDVLGVPRRAVLRRAAGADEPPSHTVTRAVGNGRSIWRMIRATLILGFVGGVVVVSAQAPAPSPSAPAFEVASVKRNVSGESRTYFRVPPQGSVSITNVTLRGL